MNQGRIWTVVKPTVGLPALLGGVAVMAFAVHFAVLNNTTWVAAYMNGKSVAAAPAPAAPAKK
jgi:light-harvesting protein B-800-850 alpha chain